MEPAGGCSRRGVHRKRGCDHRSHQEDCGGCSSYSGRGACTADGECTRCPRGCGNRGCRGGGGGDSGGLAGAQFGRRLHAGGYTGGASAAGGACIRTSRDSRTAGSICATGSIRTARGTCTAGGICTTRAIRTARGIRTASASAAGVWCIRAARGRAGGSEAPGAHQVAGASCRRKALAIIPG